MPTEAAPKTVSVLEQEAIAARLERARGEVRISEKAVSNAIASVKSSQALLDQNKKALAELENGSISKS